MLEAIEYNDILKNIENCEVKEDTIAILFANLGLLIGLEIVRNIDHYHHRAEDSMNFYLPGYGVYWGDSVLNKVDVCKFRFFVNNEGVNSLEFAP